MLRARVGIKLTTFFAGRGVDILGITYPVQDSNVANKSRLPIKHGGEEESLDVHFILFLKVIWFFFNVYEFP